jgi:DNA-binding NarL/FixJ family response regulator
MTDIKYIAIADDHAMFRKTLAVLINLFPDYKVLFDAPNGKEFINQLNPEQLPDIALLDINMPVMDGYATAAWLHENYPSLKILVLSTMEDETSIIKMIKCGAKGYVLKDADPSELKFSFDEILTHDYFYNEPGDSSFNASGIMDISTDTLVKFTQAEVAFLKYAGTELAYKDIAAKMNMNMHTLEIMRNALFTKLGVKTRVGLAIYAIKNELA